MSETPIVTPTPEPIVSPDSFVQSERRNYFYPIIFALLFLITLGSGIFFFIKADSLSKQLASLKPSPAQPTPATTDPTSSWQTYRNEKCGYSLKYPPAWELSPELEPGIIGVATITTDTLKIQLGCGDLTSNEKPESALERLNGRDTGYGVSKFESIELTTIGGVQAYKQINIPVVGSKVQEYYIFYNPNKVLNIGVTPYKNIYQEEINQILSTITILPDASTSYTCPESGYADCMPGPDAPKPSCTKEAMAWYEANCPTFQGGAL